MRPYVIAQNCRTKLFFLIILITLSSTYTLLALSYDDLPYGNEQIFDPDKFKLEPGVGFLCPKCNTGLQTASVKPIIYGTKEIDHELIERARKLEVILVRCAMGEDMPMMAYVCHKCSRIWFNPRSSWKELPSHIKYGRPNNYDFTTD